MQGFRAAGLPGVVVEEGVVEAEQPFLSGSFLGRMKRNSAYRSSSTVPWGEAREQVQI